MIDLSRGDLKVIYHPLYSMNNYVLIWGDWLSCDPHRGSHDSQSPPYKETFVLHLVATLIYLSQNHSYYIRGDKITFNMPNNSQNQSLSAKVGAKVDMVNTRVAPEIGARFRLRCSSDKETKCSLNLSFRACD